MVKEESFSRSNVDDVGFGDPFTKLEMVPGHKILNLNDWDVN